MIMTANAEPDEEQGEEEEEVEFEDLPDAAFTQQTPPCEFDDDWLRQASKQQRVAAMQGWFGSGQSAARGAASTRHILNVSYVACI